jgi:REP element-mobilizing transposase RayT
MSTTFTQLYAHIVFSVQGKKSFINQTREAEIYEFITNLVDKLGHKMLIINGTSDHIHLLVKLNPALAISDLVREIKKQSSYFINHKLLKKHGFNWEGGYTAFTQPRSQVNSLFKYIEKQKEYHRNVKFKEEYLDLHKQIEDEVIDDTIFKYKYQ